MRKRDLAPISGAVFVALAIATMMAAFGATPEPDAPGSEVISFYTDNGTRELVGSVLLGLSAVPLLCFASSVRELLREALPQGSILPGLAFGSGVAAASGICVVAGVHYAVADYGDEVGPAAAQAMNAIDGDLFVPYAIGLVALVLAIAVGALRSGLLPAWLGW